jgi:hypothetical protein
MVATVFEAGVPPVGQLQRLWRLGRFQQEQRLPGRDRVLVPIDVAVVCSGMLDFTEQLNSVPNYQIENSEGQSNQKALKAVGLRHTVFETQVRR